MITLNELKYWLSIKTPDTGEDELNEFLQGLINEAISTAESICGKRLAYCKDTFEFNPEDDCHNSIYLDSPIDIITKIQYLDESTGLTDIISANNSGITSDIYISKSANKLTLLNGNYFKNGINVIEYYHGYKDTFVSKAITAITSGTNEIGVTAILTIGSHTRVIGDVINLDGITDFSNNPKGTFKIIDVDSTSVTIQFNIGTGTYTTGGTIEYNTSDVLSIPANLKKCIKLLATISYNNSGIVSSRFGLQSKNMNASGSSGLTFRSEVEMYDYIVKELQPYKIINI